MVSSGARGCQVDLIDSEDDAALTLGIFGKGETYLRYPSPPPVGRVGLLIFVPASSVEQSQVSLTAVSFAASILLRFNIYILTCGVGA